MIAAQAISAEEYEALVEQQAAIYAKEIELQEEADRIQAEIDAAAEQGDEDNAELQAELDTIIAEQVQLEQDQADADAASVEWNAWH